MVEISENKTLEEMESDKKYKRIIRVVIAALAVFYFLVTLVLILGSLIFIPTMGMPIYVKVPWTRSNSHPSHEVNVAFLILYMSVNLLIIGIDALFMLFTLHCVAELSVCCIYASKIDRQTNRDFIKIFVKKHLRVLHLIETSSEVFNIMSFIQLLTSFGMAVSTLIKLTSEIDIMSITIMSAIASQLFIYCFLGSILSTMCEKLQESLYCSKWYEIKDISIKKNILIMIGEMQRKQGYSAFGIVNIDLETYSNVIKSAYGFFNFLLKVL
ncbi:CLUMA_CG012550, isoform A [Clunio marinus]|uniref:CLUMA_CG012550, isoform A n=1 Tax=Clunio marinus TaxID=568069 RepID=A0A1J1IFW4_9DIPT|nr:CLUMA_CG012550, isoform A [Clunio marinus]